MNRVIYADHAATTPLDPRVLEAMLPYLREQYGNPSGVYSVARAARRAVETAREQAAQALGAQVREIFFTGGGTESDNWALAGCMELLRAEGKRHLITTNIEHPAVLETCRWLEQHGVSVTRLPADEDGYVTAGQVAAAIREDTGLVSVMYANNEIGTIQPVAEIGAACRERGVLFHTDAVQAAGNVEIDLASLPVDLLSLSGHKLYGPKGVGLLFVRDGLRPAPFLHGGEQERGRRAGTENVAGIVGLGRALELAAEDIPGRIAAVEPLRDLLLERLAEIPATRINGGLRPRLCGNCNASFAGVEGETLLLSLDLKGICASSGSACTTGAPEASHVLQAIGLPPELARGSLRLTLSEHNTREEVEIIARTVAETVEHLRAMTGWRPDRR